jgi:hypothetical protein
MPWDDRGKRGSHGRAGQRTFDGQMTKMPFEVIDCRKKDFHVKDELLRHLNGFQVLAAAHVS